MKFLFFIIFTFELVLYANNSIVLTQDEKEFIQKNPIIKLTTSYGFEPFTIYNSDATVSGYDRDLLNIVEHETGLKFNITFGNWDEMYLRTLEGEFNGFGSAGFNEERKKHLNHSIPYLTFSTFIITKKNNPLNLRSLKDLKGKKVAIQKSNMLFSGIIQDLDQDIKILWVDSIFEMLNAVVSNKADFTILDESVHYVAKINGLQNAIDTSFSIGEPFKLYFWFHKDYNELVGIFNKVLNGLDAEQKMQLRDKWFKPQKEFDYDLLIKITLLFVLISLLFLYRQYMLDKSNKKLSKLTENVPGFIFQYKLFPDGHANMPYASGSIEEVFELKAKDLIEDSHPVFDIIHPDDLDMVKTSIQDSAKTMSDWNIQYRVNLTKRGLRWLEGLAKPEKFKDGSTLWHGHIHDITELKRKDELMIAQSRNAAKGEMIGMIAHQWRQPLSVISMHMNNTLADIELGELNETEVKSSTNKVLEQTQHLSNTIEDFRNFFKPDKDLSKVKMPDILEQTYSIIKDSLTNNKIELKKSYESASEVDVYSRELMQVFVNIIHNAKDALLLNNIDDAFIEIKVYENDHYVITDVYDNGGSIDKEVLPKIFDPYFSTKDEKNGTGLGLYMSKMIIENHLHGMIEAFNTQDGACVRVMLNKRPN